MGIGSHKNSFFASHGASSITQLHSILVEQALERAKAHAWLQERHIKNEFDNIVPLKVVIPTFDCKAAFGIGKATHEHKHHPKVTQVTCGKLHTLFMTNHGQVYGFGDNSCGQIIHTSGQGEHKIGRPRLVGAI